MADFNATLEPGSLRSGVQGEWSDTTRSISPCTHIQYSTVYHSAGF